MVTTNDKKRKPLAEYPERPKELCDEKTWESVQTQKEKGDTAIFLRMDDMLRRKYKEAQTDGYNY